MTVLLKSGHGVLVENAASAAIRQEELVLPCARRNASEERRPVLERQLEGTPVADRLPAVSRLITVVTGRLWVTAFRRPGNIGPAQWLVFDLRWCRCCPG